MAAESERLMERLEQLRATAGELIGISICGVGGGFAVAGLLFAAATPQQLSEMLTKGGHLAFIAVGAAVAWGVFINNIWRRSK